MNLLERFGRRYRISFDPCYNAKHRQREHLDPAMMVIPCQYGAIYPFGGTTLAVETEGHYTKAALGRLECCRLYQDGDSGFGAFLFDVANFSTVAAVVKPRRKRQISDAERQRLATIGFQRNAL